MMGFIVICMLILVFGYAAIGIIFSFALRKKPSAGFFKEPKISVIVAAKNEALHLTGCLKSLAALDYPLTKIEVIVIDDGSTDDTVAIVKEFSQTFVQIKYLKLDPQEKRRPGKAGAIMFGIEHSSGEIIFITDADCRVPPTWIRGLLSLFSDRVGLVGGFTLLDASADRTALFGKIQSCDWLYLLSAAAAAAAFGKPLSWVGNNMAFRRKAYEEVGGYEALGFSLIEDFALENAIATQTDWQVCFAPLPQALVRSSPAPSLGKFYQQRKRWSTGFKVMRPFGKMVMLISFLAHLSVSCAAITNWPLSLFCLLVLTLINLALIRSAATVLNRQDLLGYFPAFQLFFFCYTICLPVLFFFDRRVIWKEEKYPVNLAKANGSKVGETQRNIS